MVQASVDDAACPPVDGQSDDMALLRRYVDLGSQEAFSELVRRHLPWVHATCRKALGDRHTAEDAAQAVFIILARRAWTILAQTRAQRGGFNTVRVSFEDGARNREAY